MRGPISRLMMMLLPLSAVIACGSGSGEGATAWSSEDGGVDQDGALDRDGASNADVSAKDGATAGDGGATGPVTVLVTNHVDSPQAGVDVYFEDGAETKVTTDANGVARATVHAGALVHVVITSNSATAKRVDVTSISDVAPGDQIHVLGAAVTPALPDYATVMGALPLPTGSDPLAPVINVSMPMGCYFTGGQTADADGTNRRYQYTITKSCLDMNGQLTMLFEHAGPGQWTSKTITPDPMMPTVADISPDGWSTEEMLAYNTVNSAPAGLSVIGRLDYSVRGKQAFAPKYSSVPQNQFYFTGPASLSPDHISDVYTGVTINNESSESGHQLRQALTLSVSEDLATYLPRIESAVMSGTQANPIASWQAGTALGGDFSGIAALRGFNAAVGDVYWTLLFHAKAPTQVAFPALPAAVVASSSSTEPWHVHQVSLFQSSQVGYATFRQNPSFQSQLTPLLAANGATPSEIFYTQVQSQLY